MKNILRNTNFGFTKWCAALLCFVASLGQAQVRISQVYGNGGNSGAALNRDFVELYNAGGSSVSLSGYAIQYTSATGTGTWTVGTLSGSIAPKRYFLIALASGANGSSFTADLTPANASSLNLSGSAGKLALTTTTTALSGGAPTSSAIIDLVGYGTTASIWEGSGRAPAPSTAIFRKDGGETDSNDNANDFVAATAAPRSSSTVVAPYLTTGVASNIDSASAILGLNISDAGGASGATTVTEYGIFYSTTDGFANGAGTKVASVAGTYGTGAFSVNATGLTPSTTFYFKAYATSSGGTRYGTQATFTTGASISATIVPTPTTFTGFRYAVGAGPSASQTFTLAAENLTPDGTLSVNGSSSFEVSSDGTTFASTALLSYTGSGTLASNTVYVRLKAGLVVGAYTSETIQIAGGEGAANVTVSGSVIDTPVLTLDWSGITGSFSTFAGTASAAQSFTVTATKLDENLTLTPPVGYQLSLDNTTFSSTLTLTPTAGDVALTTVYIRLAAATAAGTYNGDISAATFGIANQTLAVTGTVAATPTITMTATSLTTFTSTPGEASTAQTFKVSGLDLSADLVVTAPTGFEVSTDGTNFNSSVNLVPSTGTVADTTVSVRVAAGATAGFLIGTLTASSTNAADKTTTLRSDSGILAGWDFNGTTTTSPRLANITNSNITAGGLTLAAGLSSTTAVVGAWGATSWDAVDAAAGITALNFFTFTVSPKTGQKLSVSGISQYNQRRSSTGPAQGQWQFQVGSGAFENLGTEVVLTSTSGGGNAIQQIDASAVTALQDLPAGTTVTFRFVGFNASNSGGTSYLNEWRTGLDFAVVGTVTSSGTAGPSISSFTPAFGATGSNVTITGSNFTGATSVKFNGVEAASFTINQDGTEITAVVPAAITTGKITVFKDPDTAVSTIDFAPLDGTGSVTLQNATFGSPYNSAAIFPRSAAGTQTLALTITGTLTDPAASLSNVRITLPADLGSPSGATLAGGAQGSASVSGSVVNITGAAISSGSPVTINIEGVSTPNTGSSLTADGNYSIAIETSGSGGTLVAVASNPKLYVLIPIANLRDVDSNGAPLDASKTVAVEGVVTATPLGSTTAKLSAFIQDSTAGLYIFSFSGTLSAQNWATGQVRALVGTVSHFNGLTQIDPIRDANIVSNGTASLPEPITVTLPLTNPEALEGSLIRIVGLTKSATELDNWAVPSTITAEDGSANTIDIRMAAGSSASTEPTYPVTVVGVLGQSDNTVPRDGGYQIQPRTLGDLNSVPSNIGLTPTSIAENNAVNAEVGTFSTTDVDSGDTFTYSLVAGDKDIDNASFNISGNSLRASARFDFETKSSYSVRVRTTDSANNTFENVFRIFVEDLPEVLTYSSWLGALTPSDAAFLDYVFGAVTPGTLDPSLKPTVAIVPPAGGAGGDTATLVLTYYVRQNTAGLTVTPKTSVDLAAGPSGWVTTDVTVADVGLPREVNGVNVQQKTASVPVSGAKKFLRVEAVQQ